MLRFTARIRRPLVLRVGLAMLATGVLVSCGEPAEPPDIEISTAHLDLGEILSDTVAEAFVTVYNRGGSPLVIDKVTTSCHCTEGYMVESVIPAGGESTMRVTVDPYRIKGATSTKTLTLLSNDPDEPAIEMKVSATVGPGMIAEPTRLRFGTIPQGQGAELRARLRQLQNTPLEVRGDFLRASEYVSAEIEEVPVEERSDPGKLEFDLVVKILPTAPTGIYNQIFTVTTNSREGSVTIPIAAIVGPPTAEEPDLDADRSTGE